MKGRLSKLLAISTALLAIQVGSAVATPHAVTSSVRLPALEQGVLRELNRVRAEHGLRPLALSTGLRNAATAHSRAMVERGFFEHASLDGTPFSERIRRFYPARGFRSWSVGENIFYNTAQPDAAAAVRAFLASPPHRENMLRPQWREVGIGAVGSPAAGGVFEGSSAYVLTMDFGSRSGASA